MTLGLLLGIGGVGAGVAAWGASRDGRAPRVGALVGMTALLLVLVIALGMDAPVAGEGAPSSAIGTLFDGGLVASDYLRLVVALWALDSLLVVAIAWLMGGLPAMRGLLAGTLAAIVGGTVAFAATDLALGMAAATGTGLAALIAVLASDRAAAIPAAARELRVTLGAGALGLGALAVAPVAAALALGSAGLGGDATGATGASSGSEAGAAIGVASLAIAIAVGVRFGAIPFHLRVARLTDVSAPIAVPLLLGWVSLPLAVVGLAALDHLVTPLAVPLGTEQWIVVGFALVTLSAAALAAFIQEDVRHFVGYLVIADGGLALLGFAALDPAAWGPTRIWLVAMAASKTALAAWAAVAEARFETRSLPDLRGWMRRSPILAAAFALATVATFGLPGWIVFAARGDLARLAAGAPWDALLILAGFLTLPAYLRVLLLGVGPASSHVARAAPERITRSVRRDRTLDVAVEVEGEPAVDPASVPTAAPSREAQAAPGGHWASMGARATAGLRGRVAMLGHGRTRPTSGTALGSRATGALRRDRTELISAAVLALAILAALTSWGALDIGSAAAEPAPIVSGPSAD